MDELRTKVFDELLETGLFDCRSPIEAACLHQTTERILQLLKDYDRQRRKQANDEMAAFCECGNRGEQQLTMCLECKELTGKRDFAIGQKVRIIQRETRQGKICTITERSEHNSNMYWLEKYGWRRSDEIEAVSTEANTDETQ